MIEATRDMSLPQGLLMPCKAYMNIAHCDDDALIIDLIGAAIAEFERNADITIYPTVYAWTLEDTDIFDNGAIRITPEQLISPVRSFTAAATAGDVTSSYKLVTAGLHGTQFYKLKGEAQAGLVITIQSGWPADVMGSDIRLGIFKRTATYYEYREKFTPANLQRHPDWDNQENAGFWVPSL